MADSLHVIEEQLGEAIRAAKCHRCGCFQKTVEALAGTDSGRTELASVLKQSARVFVPKGYDCLGCRICYPAIAANAFTEMHPEAADGLDLCPTEPPEERIGWPLLAGDYHVLRYGAPVAVCTLNSGELALEICATNSTGLSIVGTLHTENLGIERLIRNVVSNPNIRFLILCGEDTQQRVGHLPGQSLASLFSSGLDDQGRIVGAHGKRAVLRNIPRQDVALFRRNVELIDLIGVSDTTRIATEITRCVERNPGPASGIPRRELSVDVIPAGQPGPLVLDPAGYFVIYPEARRNTLILEHYANDGVLDSVLEGSTAGDLYQAAIRRKLLSRLDHAAYLGRELARVEQCLKDGSTYVQDRAPESFSETRLNSANSCGCSGGGCK